MQVAGAEMDQPLAVPDALLDLDVDYSQYSRM